MAGIKTPLITQRYNELHCAIQHYTATAADVHLLFQARLVLQVQKGLSSRERRHHRLDFAVGVDSSTAGESPPAPVGGDHGRHQLHRRCGRRKGQGSSELRR